MPNHMHRLVDSSMQMLLIVKWFLSTAFLTRFFLLFITLYWKQFGALIYQCCSIYSFFAGTSPFTLYFSVKFYAADPTKLVEEITR